VVKRGIFYRLYPDIYTLLETAGEIALYGENAWFDSMKKKREVINSQVLYQA